MNIDIDPRAKMRTLSVAEMQLVEIVKAISLNSRIIVMDEPTSAITEKEATVLFAQIERLKNRVLPLSIFLIRWTRSSGSQIPSQF